MLFIGGHRAKQISKTMTKVKYSALVSEMRNKLNGSVASRNRYGNYWRNKVTPVNPSTLPQQQARSRLVSRSQVWRTLSEEQRIAWGESAQNFPFVDIFGDQRIYSGQALYMKLNLNLIKIGEDSISTPPLPGVVQNLQALSVTADDSGDVQIVVSSNSIPGGQSVYIWGAAGIGPGITFYKNRVRGLGQGTVGSGQIDAGALFIARFGVLEAGTKLFAGVTVVNNETGQENVRSVVSTIVTEAP